MGYNLREIVERLLGENRRCREDTKWLTYKVLQEIAARHGQRIFLPYNLFAIFPSFESVARCKRDIMNKEGKFNDEVIPEEGVTFEKPDVNPT